MRSNFASLLWDICGFNMQCMIQAGKFVMAPLSLTYFKKAFGVKWHHLGNLFAQEIFIFCTNRVMKVQKFPFTSSKAFLLL